MLNSPQEPKKLKVVLMEQIPDCIQDPVCEEYGADFLLSTNRGLVGIQRKKFPGDFLASIQDGRLVKELAQLRELEFRIILLEGKPRYTKDGVLLNGRRHSAYTRTGFRNLCRSLQYVEGCYIEWSSNIPDTIAVLKELQGYFDKGLHASLHARHRFESKLFVPSRQERLQFFYQGLPAISVVRSIKLSEVYESPIDLFNAEISDLSKIHGIGKNIATGIYNFIRKGE